ncbi:MAG: hypothetical protein LBG76_03265 [Treponema sp.]|jgi:DNA-binding transcriptional ArsR family regulator|nr:hypothetical protein [Treponema sp.]
MNAALILSAASLVICCLSFLYFRSYIKHRAGEEVLAESRAEIYRLIAEIDSITDRDAQLIEERIKTLKALLEDTDKRLAVYARELERSRGGEALYTSLGRGIRVALGPKAAPPAVEPVSAAGELHPGTQAAPPYDETPAQAPPPAPAAKQRLRIQIAELAAGGLSPGEIASRLDISLSEVDLALSLPGMR